MVLSTLSPTNITVLTSGGTGVEGVCDELSGSSGIEAMYGDVGHSSTLAVSVSVSESPEDQLSNSSSEDKGEKGSNETSELVRDRVDFSQLSEQFPDPSALPCEEHAASSLLPSHEDDKAIREHYTILLSHVLVDNVPFFKSTFDGAAQWHITHQFYQEISSKSEVVSLQITVVYLFTFTLLLT